jgi:hypothetical protein
VTKRAKTGDGEGRCTNLARTSADAAPLACLAAQRPATDHHAILSPIPPKAAVAPPDRSAEDRYVSDIGVPFSQNTRPDWLQDNRNYASSSLTTGSLT